jgi:hypothetical protein
VDPLADLQALARAPLDIARDLRGIAEAVRILPDIEDAVRPLTAILPAIEGLIISLTAALEPALIDVHQLRGIIASQQQQVTHIEEMIQRLDLRTAVIERTVVDLQTKADDAMQLLPDPDDDTRTVLEKARDAITTTAAP